MTKLKDWIDKVHHVDRGLAALLRGLVFIRRDDAAESLAFVWHAAFHKTAGGEREADIRVYLGPHSEYARACCAAATCASGWPGRAGCTRPAWSGRGGAGRA